MLSWISHKSHRPVKSIEAAKILVVPYEIDEGMILKRLFRAILGLRINFVVALDSRELSTSLLTQYNSIDKSIRADVNCICYKSDVINCNERISFPENGNLADPGTKTDSPLTQAPLSTLSHGRISVDLSAHESRRSGRSFG